jgi:serine/threonine-protein kinase
MRRAGIEGIRKMVREIEPRRPSTRVTTLGDRSMESATLRRSDPIALKRLLRGDLDSVIMKSLEKDRSHRYGSAADFGADIARYLADEPVQARPSTGLYRARKFVRRHRFGVASAAVVVLALLGASPQRRSDWSGRSGPKPPLEKSRSARRRWRSSSRTC